MVSTSKPLRLQRKRTKGFKLVSPNGLPNVMCTRPGPWGNPFKVGQPGIPTAIEAIERYRDVLTAPECRLITLRDLRPLKGKNLVCYCKLCPKHVNGKPLDETCPDCAPCHVDVLGELLGGGM